MSGIKSSSTIKLSQLRLCIAKLIIQRKEVNSKVMWETVTRLANITGRTCWFTLNLTSLIQLKVISKKEYLAKKRNSGLLMSSFLEERAPKLGGSGNSMEENKTNHLILTYKNK